MGNVGQELATAYCSECLFQLLGYSLGSVTSLSVASKMSKYVYFDGSHVLLVDMREASMLSSRKV